MSVTFVRLDDFFSPKPRPKTKDHAMSDSNTEIHAPAENDVAPERRFAYCTGDIAEAIERALRSQDTGARLRIHRVAVKPDYSIDDDTKLLSAYVDVKIALVFPRDEKEPS